MKIKEVIFRLQRNTNYLKNEYTNMIFCSVYSKKKTGFNYQLLYYITMVHDLM